MSCFAIKNCNCYDTSEVIDKNDHERSFLNKMLSHQRTKKNCRILINNMKDEKNTSYTTVKVVEIVLTNPNFK